MCRIHNQQFANLFVKNWLVVFLSIFVPLVLCSFVIRYYSQQSLLREMDAAAYRSMNNTKATVETLLEEACTALNKEIITEEVKDFFNAKYTSRPDYAFLKKIDGVYNLIRMDMRDNLYYSVDVYSSTSDFLVNTLYRGLAYAGVNDKSLTDTFLNYMKKDSTQSLFAALRMTSDKNKENVRVITIYRSNYMKESFVSISIDEEKLIQYIADNDTPKNNIYLLLDENDRVILDTTKQMRDESLKLPEDAKENTASTMLIHGERMRVCWVDINRFGWKCVQLIPMQTYQQSNQRLQMIVTLTVLAGMVLGAILSYKTTVKLFRPVEEILYVLENLDKQKMPENTDSEIQFLLFRILELFQQNIALEKEMVERLHALRVARAKALQEQMTPHFLNNVLQVINWIAVKETGNEDSTTSKAIILLAEIINIGKEQTNNLITVAEEIAYTRKFIELEQLRFGAGISCSYNIDALVEEMYIPSISLQTLVENSIQHGFRFKEGCGNIYVSIRLNDQGGLHICVEDDGIGMEQEMMDYIFSFLSQEYTYIGEHLGIINLFQRFRLIYGEECTFDLQKSIYGGLCVLINTPCIN